jgi:hypothetical protein
MVLVMKGRMSGGCVTAYLRMSISERQMLEDMGWGQ